MTKVVWLQNESEYSYCEFVAPNTPYSCRLNTGFLANHLQVHEHVYYQPRHFPNNAKNKERKQNWYLDRLSQGGTSLLAVPGP